MRVAQITDLHIVADPEQKVLDIDTHWALERVLASVMTADSLPDIVIATGECLNANSKKPFLIALHHTPIAPCSHMGCSLLDSLDLITTLHKHTNAKLIVSANIKGYEPIISA